MPQPPNMQQMLQQVQKMQAGHGGRAGGAEARGASRPPPAAAWSRSRSPATSSSSRSRSTPRPIDPEDVELLQDMVLAAVNEALRAAQELAASKLGGVTGGMDLGCLGLPGF